MSALIPLFTIEFPKWNTGETDHHFGQDGRGGGALGRPAARTYCTSPQTESRAGGTEEATETHTDGIHTHDLDSVSRRGRDVPGALFTAGVLVRPVGAAQGPAGTVDLVLALSCTGTCKHAHGHTQRKLKMVAAQEKGREETENRGTGRRETRGAGDREKTSRRHLLMMSFTSGVVKCQRELKQD